MLLLKPSRGAAPRHSEAYDLAPYEAPARPTPGPRRPGGAGKSSAGSSSPLFLFALLLGLCGGLFYFSSREDYLLGQIAAVLLAPLGMHGLWRGGFRKLGMIAVIACLVIFNGQLRETVGAGLGAAGITSESAGSLLTMIASFLIWLTAFFMCRAIRRRMIEKRRTLLAVDRFSGMSLGLVEAATMVLCICWASTSLEPYGKSLADGRIATNGATGVKIGETIGRLSAESRARFLGDLVVRTNPLERIPNLQKAVHDLNTVGHVSADQLDPKTLDQVRRLLDQLPGGVSGELGAALQSLPKSQASRKTANAKLPARKSR